MHVKCKLARANDGPGFVIEFVVLERDAFRLKCITLLRFWKILESHDGSQKVASTFFASCPRIL